MRYMHSFHIIRYHSILCAVVAFISAALRISICFMIGVALLCATLHHPRLLLNYLILEISHFLCANLFCSWFFRLCSPMFVSFPHVQCHYNSVPFKMEHRQNTLLNFPLFDLILDYKAHEWANFHLFFPSFLSFHLWCLQWWQWQAK